MKQERPGLRLITEQINQQLASLGPENNIDVMPSVVVRELTEIEKKRKESMEREALKYDPLLACRW